MTTLYFGDNYSFAEYIEDVYTDIIDDDVDSDIAVIGHFNDIRMIASELCMYGYTLHSVSGLVDTEKDEFVLAILHHEIWIEPAKFQNKYNRIESNIVYVLSDCNSSLLKRIDPKSDTYEVRITQNDECDCDCENCSSHNLEEVDKVDESYLINGKSVSKEEYEDQMAKLDSIYRSHIKSVMNDWVEFYDEMEQWRKLLDW